MKTVVIGAGLAGLAAAAGKSDCVVFEKAWVPGGLCTSYQHGDFTFDYTGHLWHFADCAVRQKVAGWLGEPLVAHRRRAGVWYRGEMLPYPFQLALYHLPEDAALEIILGVLRARAREQTSDPLPGELLSDFCARRFGAGIVKEFLRPYLEKLFGVALEVLLAEYLTRFLPRPDWAAIFRSYLEPSAYGGYNADFYYPRGGNRRIIDALAADVKELRLGVEVAGIDPAGKTVLVADAAVSYDTLVVTAPLRETALLTKELPKELCALADDLQAAPVVALNLGVRGTAPYDLHWSYFAEPEYPFYRVGCYTNFAPELAPAGTYSLYVEVPGQWWDERDQRSAEQELLAALQQCGWLRRADDVMVMSRQRIDPAYIVPTPECMHARQRLRAYYRDCGIVLRGRFAEWDYLAMDDVITSLGV